MSQFWRSWHVPQTGLCPDFPISLGYVSQNWRTSKEIRVVTYCFRGHAAFLRHPCHVLYWWQQEWKSGTFQGVLLNIFCVSHSLSRTPSTVRKKRWKFVILTKPNSAFYLYYDRTLLLFFRSTRDKNTSAQTWNLSKNLHRRIFRLKILHLQFLPNFNSFSGKKHKKWVKMEKFTPLAKILHCR